jgi:predicted N-acetyltransferase YhbS
MSDATPFAVTIYETLSGDLHRQFERMQEISFFGEDFPADQQQEFADRFCSAADTIGYVLALSRDMVIGGVQLSRRQIDFHGQAIQLGGLGGVATLPEWRRRGVASAVVAAAMEELGRRGCDIAYLCTDIANLGGLYGRAGFVPLGRVHTYLGASGVRYRDEDGMIAPVNSPALFAAVLADTVPFDIGRGNW